MTAARARRVVVCLALAACAEAPPAGPDAAAQATACGRATAGHVGLPAAALVVGGRAERADGAAVIEVRDGDRLHLCTVDAAGRVLRLDHPPGGAD